MQRLCYRERRAGFELQERGRRSWKASGVATGRHYTVLASSYLSLSEAEVGRQLGAVRQAKVLGALESSLQLLDLQRRVNRSWLPHFLPLAVHSTQLTVLYRFF